MGVVRLSVPLSRRRLLRLRNRRRGASRPAWSCWPSSSWAAFSVVGWVRRPDPGLRQPVHDRDGRPERAGRAQVDPEPPGLPCRERPLRGDRRRREGHAVRARLDQGPAHALRRDRLRRRRRQFLRARRRRRRGLRQSPQRYDRAAAGDVQRSATSTSSAATSTTATVVRSTGSSRCSETMRGPEPSSSPWPRRSSRMLPVTGPACSLARSGTHA